MEMYTDTGLAQHYAGTVDGKSKPKGNVGYSKQKGDKMACKKKKGKRSK